MKKKPIRVYNVFHLNVWNVSIHWHLIQYTGWTRHFWQLLRQKAVLPISFRWYSTHHTIHSWNIHKHWWLIQRRCIGLIYGHTHSVTYTYGSGTKWERETEKRRAKKAKEKCRHIQMHWHMQIIELGIADMLTIVSEPSDFLYPFEYVCVCVCLLSLLVGAST